MLTLIAALTNYKRWRTENPSSSTVMGVKRLKTIGAVNIVQNTNISPRRPAVTRSTNAAATDNDSILLVYPFDKRVDSIPLTLQDKGRLENGMFFNDNLIQFYLR